MTQEVSDLVQEKSLKDPESYGLIQYSFAYLMGKVADLAEVAFTIKASYLEIYNEQVEKILNKTFKNDRNRVFMF